MFNPFATGDAYMRELFHCLQWYAGNERVNILLIEFVDRFSRTYHRTSLELSQSAHLVHWT